MNQLAKGTAPYLSSFEQLEKNGWSQSPPWVRSIRKEGISRFAERGFPTLQDEDWRFTQVDPIARLPFKPVHQPGSQGLSKKSIHPFTFGDLKCSRLVFVDGHYSKELSSVLPQPEGVRIESLAASMGGDASLIEQHLGHYALCANHTFTSLNTAFFMDGAFILIPPGKTIQDPIHLLFIASSQENGAAFHPRNLIIAQKGSEATIIESYVGLACASCPEQDRGEDAHCPERGQVSDIPCPEQGRGVYFTNTVTEVIVGDQASLEHCKFQDEDLHSFHVATIHAHLGRDTRFMAHSISTGARLARNNINATLDATGAECILNGLYMAKGEQHVDHHMVVDHAKPNCNSHEYYNGILDGRSRGVFHGRILVRKDAQKTDAKQTNKNLLLSDEATIDTKPQLEIYADDVKCTHGATVGQLNEEAIFYLRSRGIGTETARRMLIRAFASEILNRLKNVPLREHLDKLLWSRLEPVQPKVLR